MAKTPKLTVRDLREEFRVPLQKVADEIYRELVRTTPKRTGHASRGWTKPEQISRDDFNAVITTNSVPYVPYLNEGHSAQAPAGYIEDTIDKIVRRYKR